METLMAAELPQQRAGFLARSPAGSGVEYSLASDVYDESLDSFINSLSKLKLSGNMAAASLRCRWRTRTRSSRTFSPGFLR